MEVVNSVSCEPDREFGQGAFHAGVLQLTDRLGGSFIGVTVWNMRAGTKAGPYHFHDGMEEWLYVVSGSPVLRDRAGEHELEPGQLISFPSGPAGAHTMSGPGRVVVFSAGDRGAGEAFLSVYPDSDKIAAAPGVMFRRADAIQTSHDAVTATHHGSDQPAAAPYDAAINLIREPVTTSPPSTDGAAARSICLAAQVGAQTWEANLYELERGESTSPYHYKWCREEWALVISGAPTLRDDDARTVLGAGDICCFPQGPAGVHQIHNESAEHARVIVFSTTTERPMSAFYPDDGTVQIQGSDGETLLFRREDEIEDYWDGEPGSV